MNFVSKPGDEEYNENFDSIKKRSEEAYNVANEINFKTAVKGFQKQEVTEYIAELNRSFQKSQAMLTQYVFELNDEISLLNKDKEEYRTNESILKEELASVKSERDKAIEELRKIEAEHPQKLKVDLAETKKQLKLTEQKLEKAGNELIQLKQESDVMFGKKASKYTEEIDSLNVQLDNLKKENNELKEQIQNASAVITEGNRAKSELVSKEKKIEELRKIVDSMLAGNNSNEEVDELTAENKRLKVQLFEALSRESTVFEAVDIESSVQYLNLKEENNRLEAKIQEMSLELNELRKNNVSATDDHNNELIKRLKEINEGLVKKNDILVNKFNEVQDELYRLKRDAEEDLAYEMEKENAKRGIVTDSKIASFDEKIDVNDIEKRLNKLLK